MDGVVHRAPGDEVSPLAGTLAPQGIVRSGGVEGLFDDVIGRGFAVVGRTSPVAALDPEQLAFLDALGAVTAMVSADDVVDVDGTYADFWRANDVEALISRPDYHLFWAGRAADLPAAVDQLKAKLCWALSPGSA